MSAALFLASAAALGRGEPTAEEPPASVGLESPSAGLHLFAFLPADWKLRDSSAGQPEPDEDRRMFRAALPQEEVRAETTGPEETAEPQLAPVFGRGSGLRNSDKPFGRKLLRGEAIIGGVEVINLGLLLVVPKSISGWNDHPLSDAKDHLKRAWSRPPVWDEDIFFHDYIGHPFAGSVYYNMVRSQGATRTQSFLFSTLQCILFEYVVEAVAEQPSIQDLALTSTVGSLLGEVIHRWTLKMVRKDHLNLLQKGLILLLNPSYVVNNGFRAP